METAARSLLKGYFCAGADLYVQNSNSGFMEHGLMAHGEILTGAYPLPRQDIPDHVPSEFADESIAAVGTLFAELITVKNDLRSPYRRSEEGYYAQYQERSATASQKAFHLICRHTDTLSLWIDTELNRLDDIVRLDKERLRIEQLRRDGAP
ncbi:uncharacterized protein CDV56_100794 [Aspergillus thermomutatus]|uniref:Uncharacterized protein n=1 Tax=Aspergillus thermomutatus TaxID=41047 RepID=A0A397GSS4_ASPTH|nr:uncharacterized protein CDV56_100794 [Aspergillus thermomutatus]RHZ53637.1 hypothetical protein CDV56_100794 [Aspergillus thermomutatus]